MKTGVSMKGRVIRVSGLQHLVEVEKEQWQCDIRGRLKEGMRATTAPVIVGDWVEVQQTGEKTGVIESVHPRFSKFSREASGKRPFEQIVAVNLDQLIVVVAARKPAPKVGFVDRAVVTALKGCMKPVICVNKVDLDREGVRFSLAEMYRPLGYTVCFTSALSGEGVEEFGDLLQDRVSAIVGQSGVGKSSLLNRIDPHLSIKTQEIMKQHDRGRHTTTVTQLYPLMPVRGYIADTPGIKELRLWDVKRSELVDFFVEMNELVGNCQFRDCSHMHEPGCAVREGVEQGDINTVRYDGYRRIWESL